MKTWWKSKPEESRRNGLTKRGKEGKQDRQTISQPIQEEKGRSKNKNLNDKREITIKQGNFQNYNTTLNNFI